MLRTHVHAFFRDLHARIGRHRGERAAMTAAVGDLLEGRTTVAFDELHLHDPGDAMLLAPLMTELVRRRVVWIATSNYPPERLLANPLYHHLFAPVVALIRAHAHVVHLHGDRDYRSAPAASGRGGRLASGGFSSGAWIVARSRRDHGVVPFR